MATRNLQAAHPVRLATEDMASLWQAATGALLHGPACTCVGFGAMHRSRPELERDIAEFLIAKYEDRRKDELVRLFQRWVDEQAPGTAQSVGVSPVPVRSEGLLQWIDRNAPSMDVPTDDLCEIGSDIRTLLQSMAAPAGEFICR